MTDTGFAYSLAVVIGINQYQNGIAALKTPTQDAIVIGQVLKQQHQYNQVRVLLDQAATLEKLRNLLHQDLPGLFSTTGTGSDRHRLFFYFAGHGVAQDGDAGPAGFLIPCDACLHEEATYLPMTEVYQAFNRLNCHHFLGVFDCCFAGAFRWSSTRDIHPAPKQLYAERFNYYISSPAWQIITSAGYDQTAADALVTPSNRGQVGQHSHSPFAFALIEALRSGKADLYPLAEQGKPSGDGVITTTELQAYLQDRMRQFADAAGKRQTPSLFPLKKHENGDFMFLVPGYPLNLPNVKLKNPYRGLASYNPEDRELFFGRDLLIQALLQFVPDHPLTVVLGASGSGKSSLVKAGLIPRLASPPSSEAPEKQSDRSSPPAAHDACHRWQILGPMRPGESPLIALNTVLMAAQLPPITIPAAAQRTGISRISTTADSPSSLVERTLADSLTIGRGRSEAEFVKLLLIIDQAEELLTLCRHEAARTLFMSHLRQALEQHGDRFHIMLTLRSDFEIPLRQLDLEAYWETSRFIVPGMSREELRQVIEEPAASQVLYFNPPKLIEQLIDEVWLTPGALPLLSFTLSELFRLYERSGRSDRAITQADYDRLAGVMGSLTKRADEEYEKLKQQDAPCERTLQNVMLRMVSIGEGELARRRVSRTEIEFPNQIENHRANEVIKRFVDARLLVEGQDEQGDRYVEPAHDALVRSWSKLRDWKNREQEALILQRQLTPAAWEWQHQRHLILPNPSHSVSKNHSLLTLLVSRWQEFWQVSQYLWHDNPRLTVIHQEVRRSNNNWLNQLESEFVQRSLNRRRMNVGVRWGLVAIALLSITGAAGVALYQRNQAHLERLSVQADNQRLINPLQGLLTALQAVSQNRVATISQVPFINTALFPSTALLTSVEISLGRAVASTRETNQLPHQGYITSVAFSSDRQWLVSGGKQLRLWTVDGQSQSVTFMGHTKQITSVAFSPDSQKIASGSKDQTTRLWDLQGNLLQTREYPDRVTTIAFSPNGRWLASVVNETIHLWDVQHNTHQLLRAPQEKFINAIAFSPDSTQIASASEDGVIRLWNMGGQLIRAFPVQEEDVNAMTAIAFHPAGNQIVTGSDSGMLKSWNLNGAVEAEFIGHEGRITSVVFDPKGDTVISSSTDRTLRVWNLQGNLITEPLRGHEDFIRAAAIDPSGRILASASDDQTVRLWAIGGERYSTSILQDYQTPFDITFADAGNTVVSLVNKNGTIQWWSWSNQNTEYIRQPDTKLQLSNAERKSIYSLDLSPAGAGKRLLATGSRDGRVRLWDLNGNSHRELPTDPQQDGQKRIRSIAFSPDGTQIISSQQNGMIYLWNLEHQSKQQWQLGELEKGDYATAIGFSANRQLVLAGSFRGKVYMLHLQTEKWQQFDAHAQSVTAIAADNQRIYTSSEDGTIRIWDFQGELRGGPLQTHQGVVEAIAISSDLSGVIHSVGHESTVRTWFTNSELQLQTACAMLENHPALNDPANHQIKRLC